MDEAARTSGPQLEDGQRGPDEIRADIEQSREELGDTVEALAAKTDVKAQAQAKVEDVKDQARAKVESAGFEQIRTKASEKPVHSAAAAAFVAGLLVGRITAKR